MLGMAAFPMAAFLAGIPSSRLGIEGTSPIDPNQLNLTTVLDKVLNWGFGLLIALAGIFILIAAYYYLTAGGDEESIKTAKNLIIYALVAVAVAFLSRGLVAIVGYFFTGGGGSAPSGIIGNEDYYRQWPTGGPGQGF